jgi:uncharacterized membrane protein (DUF106 family)
LRIWISVLSSCVFSWLIATVSESTMAEIYWELTLPAVGEIFVSAAGAAAGAAEGAAAGAAAARIVAPRACCSSSSFCSGASTIR